MLLFSGFSPVVDALCFEQTLVLVLIIISLIRPTQKTERAEKTFWQMMRRNSYFSQSSWIARLLENNKEWTCRDKENNQDYVTIEFPDDFPDDRLKHREETVAGREQRKSKCNKVEIKVKSIM